MKTRFVIFALLAALILPLGSFSLFAAEDDVTEDIDELNEDIEEKQTRIDEIERRMDSYQSEIDAAQDLRRGSRANLSGVVPDDARALA